jgi:beta-barrel assembly-enhancing protease
MLTIIRQPALVCALLLAAAFGAAGCQVDALTGKRTFNIYSYEQEKQLGDGAIQPILAELGGPYPDPQLQAYVTRVGNEIVAAARTQLHDRARFPDWEFQFYIANTSMINAFALPGGHIVLTRGIMLELNDEAELAGLLGHEIAHVFARHSAERMSEMSLMLLPVMVLGAFEETQGVAVVGMVAVQLLSLSYSRDNEREADMFGLRFAADAGYHPTGMIELMRMIEGYVDASGGPPPEFLSTHPNPGNRIADMTRQVQREYPDYATGDYKVNAAQYTRAITAMNAARAAYALADDGDAHMELAYLAHRDGDPVTARTHFEQALALYVAATNRQADHAILHVNVAQAQYYLERYNDAEQSIRRALQLEPRTFWPNFIGGVTALQMSQFNVAAERMERALHMIPDSPVGVYYLALAYDGQGRRADAVTQYRRVYDMFNGQGELAERARQRLIALGEPDPAERQ